jgi:CheY-like chemotaxis protein
MAGSPTRRVLIIDDDPLMRETLAEALEDMGVTAEGAADGLDGLARLRQGPRPCAVLLDLRMPRLDGAGFLREVRADPVLTDLPVITMSGLDDETVPGDTAASLRKPFDLDELARILASLCG